MGLIQANPVIHFRNIGMEGTGMNTPTNEYTNQRIHVINTLCKHAVETNPIARALRCVKHKPAGSANRMLIEDGTPGNEISGRSTGYHLLLLRCQVV